MKTSIKNIVKILFLAVALNITGNTCVKSMKKAKIGGQTTLFDCPCDCWDYMIPFQMNYTSLKDLGKSISIPASVTKSFYLHPTTNQKLVLLKELNEKTQNVDNQIKTDNHPIWLLFEPQTQLKNAAELEHMFFVLFDLHQQEALNSRHSVTHEPLLFALIRMCGESNQNQMTKHACKNILINAMSKPI